MAGGVNLPEVVDGDLRVDLSGCHRGVAEHLLDHADIGASSEQMSGEGVTQSVGRDVPPFHLSCLFSSSTGQTGALGGMLKNAPGGLTRQRTPQSVEKNLRHSPASSGQLRSAPNQIRLQGVPGVLAHGNDSLLAPFAEQAQTPRARVEIIHHQADSFRDPRTRGVQDLQERSIPHADRIVPGRGGFEQTADLVDAQSLGQSPPHLRRAHLCRRVGFGHALIQKEAVQTAYGSDGACRGGSGQGPSAMRSGPQRLEKSHDVRLLHIGEYGGAAPAQEVGIATQIPLIGGQGIRAQTALDAQVRQIPAQGTLEGVLTRACFSSGARSGGRGRVPKAVMRTV